MNWDVAVVYRRSFAEMPAWPGERDAALNAGVNFLILTAPLGYEAGPSGRLEARQAERRNIITPNRIKNTDVQEAAPGGIP